MAKEIAGSYLSADANLQGYWRLENVSDSGPNGYTLTNNGTATFSAAKFNNGVSLNGSSQWLSTTNASAPNLYPTGDFTIVGWINPTNLSATRSIVSNSNSSVNTGWSLQVNVTTGYLDFRSFKSGDDQSVTGATGMSAGAQNHVAIVYRTTGQSVTLFTNGVKATGNFSRALVASTGDFSIGRLGSFSAQYFLGLIDDVAIFDRALSDDEIQEEMFSGSASFSPSLSVSLSPSLSFSLSPSLSVSAGPSITPSFSISLSPSSSFSISISLSPSSSPSASQSPSASPSASPVENSLSVDYVCLKFLIAYGNKYSSVGNTFSDKYSEQSTAYANKYTTKTEEC